MTLVDFVISNDRHHTEMFEAVVRQVSSLPGYRCRVISLCEFRGLVTPEARFRMDNVQVVRLVPKIRSSSSGGQQGKDKARRMRRLARRMAWYLLLWQPIRSWLRQSPDLVVLANDDAYPYDRIVQSLKRKQIPFVLAQEGIRYPLPRRAQHSVYGGGGATAVAAWGETSAGYFRQVGVPERQICLTGCPRFDSILSTDWRPMAQSLAKQWGLGENNLLFLSNPIDDQGYCSTAEKIELLARFADEIGNLFSDETFRLIIKLHGRESLPDVVNRLRGVRHAEKIVVLRDEPLYPLFYLSRAAVVLASTAGLEAMLFDVRLGVLEIPGYGFFYDYVSSGAAKGLRWEALLGEQVAELMRSAGEKSSTQQEYLERNFSMRAGATERMAQLIGEMTAKHA